MKLLLTSNLVPRESFQGYLLRLTELNVYPNTSYVSSLINPEGDPHRLTMKCDVQRLSLALDLRDTELDRVLQSRLWPCADEGYMFYGQQLTKSDVRCTRPQVCVFCLQEGGCCEAFWDLNIATHCTKHGVALSDSCSACGSQLSWARGALLQCSCGESLVPAKARIELDSDLILLSSLIRSKLYREPIEDVVRKRFWAIADLNLWMILDLCDQFWRLLARARGEHSAAKKNHRRTGRNYEDVASLLVSWPFGFRNAMAMSLESLATNSSVQPSFDSFCGWVFYLAKLSDESGSKFVENLIAETYSFAARHWPKDLCSRPKSHQHLFPSEFRWGLVSEARHILNRDARTIRRLLALGKVPTKRVTSNGGKTRVLVDLDWARGVVQSISPGLDERVAAKRLGISHEFLRVLRKTGVYEDLTERRFIPAYAPEDLDALRDKLLIGSSVRREAASGECRPLDRMFREHELTYQQRAGVLKAILTGQLPVVRGTPTEMLKLQVSTDHWSEYAERWGVQGQPSVTVREACTRIGCFPSEIPRLVDAGFLTMTRRRWRSAVERYSLEKFLESYELVKHIAARHRAVTKLVVRLASEVGIELLHAETERNRIWMIRIEDVRRMEEVLHASRLLGGGVSG